MSYKTIINEASTTKNDNLLSEAGIVDIAARLARYASQDLLNEIGTVLKKTITKIEDLTSDDLIKILGKEGTHINSFKQSLFKEIEKDFTWLGKKEAQNMTVRDLSSKFYELGYEKGIAGKYAKWLENQKKGLKFKPSTKTPKVTPNPPTPPTTTTVPPIAEFNTLEDAWTWFGTKFKETNVSKKLGPKQGEFFVKQMKTEISNALDSKQGQQIIVNLTNMKTMFDKLPPLQQKALLEETQKAIYSSNLGKGLGPKALELFWGGLKNGLFLFKGANPEVKMKIVVGSTLLSIVIDTMQFYEAYKNDTKFEGHFGLDFSTVVAGKAILSGVLSYFKALTPLVIVNILLFLSSSWNYLWYKKERNKEGGKNELSDTFRKLTIVDAKDFVKNKGEQIGIDKGDVVTYELVDSKGALMNDQEGDARYVMVYLNGTYFTKLGKDGLTQKVIEIK